jgi:hypothetical protein
LFAQQKKGGDYHVGDVLENIDELVQTNRETAAFD